MHIFIHFVQKDCENLVNKLQESTNKCQYHADVRNLAKNRKKK